MLLDEIIWGTLELSLSGHSGSEQGKFFQAYSPISHLFQACGEHSAYAPTTMKAFRSRKDGSAALVDTILANLDKAGGVRLEARGTGAKPMSIWRPCVTCWLILQGLFSSRRSMWMITGVFSEGN